MKFFAVVEPEGKVGKTYPLIFQPKVELENPLDSDFLKGTLHPESSVAFVREAGTGACDFHHIRHMFGYIVSATFCDALRDHECSGWSTYPVLVHDRKGAVLPCYEGLVILGRGRRIDRTHVRESKIQDPLGYIRTVRVGYEVVESSWDGSDVFLMEGPEAKMGLSLFLSERGARALTARNLRGFSVERVPEIQWPSWWT